MGLQYYAKGKFIIHIYLTNHVKDASELVDKEDICDYVLKSPEILELYDIDPVNLRSDLYAFPSDHRDAIHFEEFLTFLQNTRNAAEGKLRQTTEGQSALKTKSDIKKKSAVRFTTEGTRSKSPKKGHFPKPENLCMLSEETLDTIKEIFHEVDKYEDLIVKRQVLIKRLRDDVRIARVLHKPAIHIVEIDKYFSMDRLLRQIEEEETTAVADQKKTKEYISLNQFLKYFTNYETPDDLAEKMGDTKPSPRKSARSTKGATLGDEDDQDIIEVAHKHMEFFQKQFELLPKKRGAYVDTMQLIDGIRGGDYYSLCKREPGRRKAAKFTLQPENIEEVLNRMENEGEKYINWDDFTQYFTRRGRPK